MPASITASMLYDLVQCPHRVELDLFGDPTKRDPVSPFVELLWKRGSAFEKETVSRIETPFVNLSAHRGDEKERRTRESIAAREPLIYGARLTADDLVGEPDLLRREGEGYVPIDIKSGSGEEGHEERRSLKVHYAVQLGLYVDVLERAGLGAGRRGYIWDIDGEEVPYDLSAARGPRTPTSWWDEYAKSLEQARAIATNKAQTLPASSSICKQCHWHTSCLGTLRASDDLTLLPELGRAKRDAMVSSIATVRELADADISRFVKKKKTVFSGIGPETLAKFQERARLRAHPNPKAYRTAELVLPTDARELFFDIEVDPMRDICYLHGFVERTDRDNGSERYVAYFVDHPTQEEEESAFARAWAFLRAARPCAVLYYAPYERTIYRKLQEKYPAVCTADELEALFTNASTVDLYTGVVKPSTEWPTVDFSIKTLAKFLGFAWRDTDPSGAASIEWYHRWVESGDPALRERLLAYNEDDCRATRVLLDAVRALPLGP